MRFGAYLATAIEKAGISQREFARRAKSRQQNVNEIVHGRRVPPLAHLERWADLLKEHVDRAQFLELARLEHCPPEIQTLVAELRSKTPDHTHPSESSRKTNG